MTIELTDAELARLASVIERMTGDVPEVVASIISDRLGPIVKAYDQYRRGDSPHDVTVIITAAGMLYHAANPEESDAVV